MAAHSFSMVTNGKRCYRNSRTDRRRVFVLGGKVGHMTRHVRQLFRDKRSKAKVTSHDQEIYAVNGFSIGDAREQTTLNRRRSSIKVE